jgi:molybdopterin biosynthesis enzyme
MSSPAKDPQKIGRLTPLKDVLAHIAAQVVPVAARECAVADGLGCVLAADVIAPSGRPAVAIALRDGFAVRAEEAADGSSYAPAQLQLAQPVDAGDPLPPDADAVATPDTVVVAGSDAQAVTPVAIGDGVLVAHGDVQSGAVLKRADERLRQTDVAVLYALGIEYVAVRKPRVRIIVARAADDAVLESIAALIGKLASACGGEVVSSNGEDNAVALAAGDADLILIVGGSGVGPRDVSVHLLAQVGTVAFHGVGIAPGETVALGTMNHASVLIMPGRLDAAIAAWVTVGEAVLAPLCGCNDAMPSTRAALTRKVTSTIGLAEVVFVQLNDTGALPLASGYTPLQAIAQANGYMMVPADSEGYPAGTIVDVRAMP